VGRASKNAWKARTLERLVGLPPPALVRRDAEFREGNALPVSTEDLEVSA